MSYPNRKKRRVINEVNDDDNEAHVHQEETNPIFLVPRIDPNQTTHNNPVENKDHQEEEESDNDNNINTSLNTLEKLCAQLKAEPTNSAVRAELEGRFKKLYIKNGGLSIITNSVLPQNLEELTNEQLINAIDQALLRIQSSKKNDLVAKCINIASNAGALLSRLMKIKIDSQLFNLLKDDFVLQEAICGVFLGKNLNPAPLTTLTIGVLSHLSNFTANVAFEINNKQQNVSASGKLPSTNDSNNVNKERQPNDKQTGKNNGGTGGNSSASSPATPRIN
jgi:hypothetical protein